MTYKNLAELLKTSSALLVEGFDDCVMGHLRGDSIVVYSFDAIVEKIASRLDIPKDDAEAIFDCSFSNVFLGERMPIFVEKFSKGEPSA